MPLIISEILARRDVLTDVKAADKAALLGELSSKLAGSYDLQPANVATALLEREKLGSTGTGDGIAIPHARIKGVSLPLGFFARLARPLAFDAIDAKPVDLVFVLLLPASNEGRHLNALAAVARRLRDGSVQVRLRRAASADEIYAVLSRPDGP